MKTNLLPQQDRMLPGKPVITQQIASGAVCKECLNEDFDSCVCPETEN